MQVFQNYFNYDFIETLVLSFGVSLILLILTSYVLIAYNASGLILAVLSFLSIFLFSISNIKQRKNKTRPTSQKSDFESAAKIGTSWLSKHKFTLLVLFLAGIFFGLALLLRQSLIYRMPDEYYYLWVSDPKILPVVNYRIYPFIQPHALISSTLKLGFLLTLSSYFNYTGTNSFSPIILSLLFYSMLVCVTYLIGSLVDKKTGVIAALFIATNPIIWFWNNRIMPDILYACLASASFYFFYQSFRIRGSIDHKHLVPFCVLALLSYMIEPKMIFVWGLPFIVYFLTSIKKPKVNLRTITILSVLISLVLIFIAGIAFYSPWFFSYDLPGILGGLFSVTRFSLQDWSHFLSPGPQGAVWNTWAFPYYYTYAIIILALIGAIYFLLKHKRRESFLVFSSIFLTLYLHSTVFSNQDARFSFLIFPLFVLFAAIGFRTNLGTRSLFLVPFLVLLFILLPINEPSNFAFSQVEPVFGVLSKVTAIGIVIYKILEGVLPKINKLSIGKIKWPDRLHISNQVAVVMIVLILMSSLAVGQSIVTNLKYDYNDYVTPNSTGLPQAGSWLLKNAPANSTVITNVRPQILNYYANNNFDIETEDWNINRPNAGKILTPNTEQELYEFINGKNYTFLVVFSKPLASEFWKRPFFLPYINENTLFTVYVPAKEEPVKFFSCDSTENLLATRAIVNFSLDTIDNKEGLSSIKVDGITNERGQTRISYNIGTELNMNRSNLAFWFKLDNAVNPNYLSLVLIDSASNYRYWANDTRTLSNWNSHEWQNIQVSLSNSTGQLGNFDITRVKSLEIYVYADENTPITYHLDGFQSYSTLNKIVYSFP